MADLQSGLHGRGETGCYHVRRQPDANPDARRSAQYGEPDCPANPRCADLFTRPGLWGTNSYGIGGEEEARLSIGTIRTKGASHTLIVNLDAVNHADAAKLSAVARPILESVQLPTN